MTKTPLTLLTLIFTAAIQATPTVFPVGTTIYDPGRAWNGYTVLVTVDSDSAVLIDMNGNTELAFSAESLTAIREAASRGSAGCLRSNQNIHVGK